MWIIAGQRFVSIGAVAMLGATGVATVSRTTQHPVTVEHIVPDSVSVERAYAAAVATIADGAMHRLDFFPARAQLRVQTAFMAPAPDASIPFDDLATRGSAAAMEIDVAVERLAAVSVPGDLKALNTRLVNALKDATRASSSLTAAAHACQQSMTSVDHCQVPFSSASSRVAESYKHYIEARAKIRAQVLDTDTHLEDFRPAR